jgi:excisionase family DNA binding protein
MKRTHKLRALGDVAGTIAAARSIQDAARQLGVDRSTVHRWIASGKVSAPAAGRRTARQSATTGTPGQRQTPESWARWVRRQYLLDATEQTLVGLTVDALRLARDESARPEVRLAATARAQSLIRQLKLENAEDGEAENTKAEIRVFPRRVS